MKPRKRWDGPKLKPCPFCGSDDVATSVGGDGWAVICKDCWAIGPECSEASPWGEEKCAEYWNRRKKGAEA